MSASNEAHTAAFENAWTLAKALPPEGDNPVRFLARTVLICKMFHTGATLCPGMKGDWDTMFAEMFILTGLKVPNDQASAEAMGMLMTSMPPLREALNPTTGLDNDFWNKLATAFICEAIYNIDGNRWARLNINKVKEDLKSCYSQLRGKLAGWYAVVAGEAKGEIRNALMAIPAAERSAAKQHYVTGLTSDAYINMMAARDASGEWSNRDWDLFHHWIKLKALGAGDDEIDHTITAVKGKGLPVPGDLQAVTWRGWSKWFGTDLDGNAYSGLPMALHTAWRWDAEAERAGLGGYLSFSTVFVSEGPGQTYRS